MDKDKLQSKYRRKQRVEKKTKTVILKHPSAELKYAEVKRKCYNFHSKNNSNVELFLNFRGFKL